MKSCVFSIVAKVKVQGWVICGPDLIQHLPVRNLFPKGMIETKTVVLKTLDTSCTEHISLNIHGLSADGL